MHSTVVITYFTGHKNAAKGVKGGRAGGIHKIRKDHMYLSEKFNPV